jgi:mRNA interferase MazF
MTKHKIVLVPFPFDDLSATKVRPAVCLTNPIGINKHVVLAFITSVKPTDAVDTDVALDAGDVDFKLTGLRVSSTLRLHRMITVTTTFIRRELGQLPSAKQVEVSLKLRKLFELT